MIVVFIKINPVLGAHYSIWNNVKVNLGVHIVDDGHDLLNVIFWLLMCGGSLKKQGGVVRFWCERINGTCLLDRCESCGSCVLL